MQTRRNLFLLEYKSRLFDLVEDIEKKEIKDWITIVLECFQAKKAVFYRKALNMEAEYELFFTPEPNLYPEILQMEQSLMNANVLHSKALSNINPFSYFNYGFHFKNQGQGFGILFLLFDHDVNLSTEEIDQFIIESEKLFKLFRYLETNKEEIKYKELFRVTEKFHSSMSVDVVLTEIISTLKRVFSQFEYNLLLSNDANHDRNLPIKALQMDDADEASMKAYVHGDVQIQKASSGHQKTILYAPLCGKQGIYGVLQVIAFSTIVFDKSEVEFIRLLANTGGSALENARLYQQSRRLIDDLQLINDTSHILNSSSRLDETVLFLRAQILKSFHSDIVGFVLLSENKNEKTILEGSSEFFYEGLGKVYLEFITNEIVKTNESMFLSNVQNKLADNMLPFSSLMAVPMLEGKSLKGYCVILHKQPFAFTFEMFKLFQSLIHHSALAVTNSILREELEKMVITDHLTQLFAKSHLNTQIHHSMENDNEGTFILLDIDNFKKVNDTYGHQIGDEILKQVAKLIKQNLRSTDIGARWGGEELAIYLPGVPLRVGAQVAKRLVQAVYEQTNPKITISCGVSYWFKERKDKVENLFNRADIGLYHAKERGKNQVVIKEDSKLIV